MFRQRYPVCVPLAALLLLTLPGCSPFHKAWRQAGDQPGPGPGIQGRWEGTWESTATGHAGRLRCVIEPIEPAESSQGDQYLARYHAVYAGFLTFTYDVPMRTQTDGDTVLFEGQADLGKLAGGVYRYTGRIEHPEKPDQATFTAQYHAETDRGVFHLQR